MAKEYNWKQTQNFWKLQKHLQSPFFFFVLTIQTAIKSYFKSLTYAVHLKAIQTLKTCSFQLQVCLSMYDLLVDTRRYRVISLVHDRNKNPP